MKPVIALFRKQPQCSNQCCTGMIHALGSKYDFKMFTEKDISRDFLKGVDIIAFPGGIGDADKYYEFFKRRKANIITEYIDNGGRYLGICMGAYWAGSHYFDVFEGLDAVQYIKRPRADIRRSFSTVAPVNWNGVDHSMFFYDGCSIIGAKPEEVVATYSNGDAMAVLKNRVGLIGCHLESEESWYKKPYLKKHWHRGEHHKLLLEFVDKLMERGQDGNAAVC